MASLLQLVVGGLPFPHGGPNGNWSYRHAVRPDGPTVLDHQVLADFRAYEARHARLVEVAADPELSDWSRWPTPRRRPGPREHASQCCTHVYSDGCNSSLVCHGTPAAVAATILRQGLLLPAVDVTGQTAEELARSSTWGEPPDYFDHVMFANGRCTAPEAVARSRSIGRDLEPLDLTPGYPTAVRFCFDWSDLAAHPDAVFDGVHPVKIGGPVELDRHLVAVVVNRAHVEAVSIALKSSFAERVIVLDISDPLPHEWACAANDAVSARR